MMNSTDHRVKQVFRRGILTLGAIALLGGCSSVPDAVNPVEWYKGTRDWITGDDNTVEVKQAKAKPVPGADKDFPNLNAVPDRPAPSIEAEREKMASTLVADRDSARYTDEKIRRQSIDVSEGAVPRPPAPAASVSAVAAPQPVRATISAAPRVPPAPAAPAVSAAPRAQVAALPKAAPPASPPAPPVIVANQPVVTANAPPRGDSVTYMPVVPHQPIAVEPVRVPVPPPRAALPGARQAALVPPLTSLPSPPPIPPMPRALPPAPSPLSAIEPSGGPPAAGTAGGPAFSPANRFSPNFPATVNSPQPQQFAALPPQASQPGGLVPVDLSTPAAVIRFATGSARIGSQDRRAIQRAYQAYRARGGRIHVMGHASSRTRNMDRVRHQLANFQISYDRAKAVADELVRLGVDPSVIVVNAMSDQHPAFFEVMPAGEAGNRRAEIFFEN
jgi:outer membrane protein OmpA-like peptidoglycan-associated protein